MKNSLQTIATRMLLACLLVVAFQGILQAQHQQKIWDHDAFLDEIHFLHPGSSKFMVEHCVDKPYKITFYQNERGEVEEQWYYRVSAYVGRRSTIIYCFSFRSSKLVSLTAQEFFDDVICQYQGIVTPYPGDRISIYGPTDQEYPSTSWSIFEEGRNQ